MHYKSFRLIIVALFSMILVNTNCKKSSGTPSNPVSATVTTSLPSNVTSSSADLQGTITSDGGSPIMDRGFEWFSTYSDTGIHRLGSGTGTGIFTNSLSALNAHTAYSVRAYGTNALGIAYGDYQSFVTGDGVPSLRTDSVQVQYNLWKTSGRIISAGGGTVTEYGTCWSTHTDPTVGDSKAIWLYTSQLTFDNYLALAINSTYYIRAYAKNEFGVGYGNQVKCVTGIAVGLYHGGGIIFYVDGSGQHGHISSLANQSEGMRWSSIYLTTNANSATDGALNTTRIINTLGSGTYAAKLCRTYTGGGFTDWYLPAIDQLNAMSSLGIIPDFPGFISLNGTVNYWSSTENSNGDAYNDLHFSNNTFMRSFDAKNSLFKVRAVRTF